MKFKNNISIIILVIALLIGLSLLLYPSVSNWWNERHQSYAIANYVQNVGELDNDQYNQILNTARNYNSEMAKCTQKYILSEDEKNIYENTLNVGTTGIMGYIEIPEIDCYLPIYHGTDDSVMQVGVGHIEWTSLPVGGKSSHCVLSGHRGLPSAKLFTNLDKLSEKDTFTIYVLDEVLTYEIDQILIVEPDQTDDLTIEDGKDYCTLVTCTPYGVNTHRLLVRGKRIQNEENKKSIHVAAEADLIEPTVVAPIVAVPILFVLVIIILITDRKKRLKRVRRDKK